MSSRFGTLLLLLPVALAGCSQGEIESNRHVAVDQKVAVEVTQVSRSKITSTIELVGTLIPIRATTIVSDVDGIIESFPRSSQVISFEQDGQVVSEALGLDIGHAVAAGDILVQIEPTDFQLAVNVAKAQLELADRDLDELNAWRRQEEVDRLEAACAEARATYERADADLKREQRLLDHKVVSESAYDEKLMAYRTAEAAIEQTEAAKRLYLAGPTPQKVAVAAARVFAASAEVELRQEKLNKTTIKARYDGVISDRYVDVGDRVTAMPRVEIMQIVDPKVLFAEVSVPERYQQEIKLGDVATISGDGRSGELPAVIDLINSKVDPETRTFRVRATIDNRAGHLKPGGFVNVEISLAASEGALSVPREAVTFNEGQPAVFVLAEGRVHKMPVEIGLFDGSRYEITAGVNEDDLVVVGRMSLLDDGMEVDFQVRQEATGEPVPVAMAEVLR